MKVGDLVYKTPSPYGRNSFIGIIISILGGDGWFDVLTTEGKVEFCHVAALDIISESR